MITQFLVKKMPEQDFSGRRAEKGKSDKVGLDCSCNNNGTVLLFYRYIPLSDTLSIATMLKSVTHSLSGKIRISKEGFNITVAGTTNDIKAFIEFMSSSDLMADIPLTEQESFDFFKPSPGCYHGISHL
jgi:hypothetical protein